MQILGCPTAASTSSDEELEDHLPALLDSINKTLEGKESSEEEIQKRGALHGTNRRAQGYSVAQLIWELAIFRKLLREALEDLTVDLPPATLFNVREAILVLTDKSEFGSVERYVEEAQRERDAALEQVRQADRSKDRFLAVLSHELRNPLASIRTAVQILQNTSSTEPQRQSAIEIINRQAGNQARLLDDLLDLNRISQGRIELRREPMDLRHAVKNASTPTCRPSNPSQFRYVMTFQARRSQSSPTPSELSRSLPTSCTIHLSLRIREALSR